VEALSQLVQSLPPGLPATVFVVCHFPATSHSVLPDILSRRGPLLAVHARDGEPIYPGQIYVAPPDHHLILEASSVRVTRWPREHRLRPAIDPLFRSAARVFGTRVIGVLLSGILQDGVAGLLAIRAVGGVAVVQDPADALLPGLPQSARDIAGADHVVPARELGALLAHLLHQAVRTKGDSTMPDPLDTTAEAVLRDMSAQTNGQRRGHLSVLTCPECGGCLWQVDERELLRFRCHVGHVYLGEALLAEQSATLEAALWKAVRTFKEKGVLARQLAAGQDTNPGTAPLLLEEARLADHYAGLIQQYLLQGMGPAPEVPAAREEVPQGDQSP
jgi:two-component system chemotaxis response regulator CheB